MAVIGLPTQVEYKKKMHRANEIVVAVGCADSIGEMACWNAAADENDSLMTATAVPNGSHSYHIEPN